MTVKKPVTILHLSDLHYKISRAYDQSIVIEALLSDLEKQAKQIGHPDIVVFSGDLVHSADDPKVYEKLYDNFIEELLERTNCDHTLFFATPGNHDLHRSFIEQNEAEQSGMEATASERNALNNSYQNGELAEFARSKSRAFFEFAEFFEPQGKVYSDELVSVYLLDQFSLAVVTVNTAWLGRGGLNKANDILKLAVPEAAVTKAFRKIPTGYFTVLAQHHPANWQADHSAVDFRDVGERKSDLILYGHVHEPSPVVQIAPEHHNVHNQSGALYTGRDDRYLGYSQIRVCTENKHTQIIWRSYFDKRRAFDVATNVNDSGGVFYSNDNAETYFKKLMDGRRLDAVRTWVANEVAQRLAGDYAEGILDKPMPDLFVAPPLTKTSLITTGEDDEKGQFQEVSVSLEEVVTSSQNILVEALPEHGKSTLLWRMCTTLAAKAASSESDRHIVPVMVSFSEFVPGTKRIEKAIRDQLPALPAETSLDDLLENGCMQIYIDDLEPNDTRRLKELREFIALHKSNRFIISQTTTRATKGLVADLGLGAHFDRVNLRQLRRNDIRQLARKIDENGNPEEELLERVIAELKAINVPATPINSSLLLDILTKDASYSPLNRPTLIERFIETLLQKRSIAELQRKKFDFRNQVHYLGTIAKYMCRTNRYVLPYHELIKVTTEYLANLGLSYGPKEIVDNALLSKIFVENAGAETVSFRFRAFLEYFVAAQMRDDHTFKEWIMAEDRYLSYLNEIEYYSGLQRNDSALLQTVSARHLAHHKSVFGNEFEKILTDDHFQKLPTSLEGNEKFANDLAEQLQEVPLTEAERDELLDAELPRDAEGRQEVFRPSASDVQSRYILSLFMYTNLVKNTELIDDTEKRYHLSYVLQSWSSTIMGSFLSIPSLVKKRRMTINGLTYTVNYPREFTDDEVAKQLSIGLPNEIARLLYVLIGTEKLESQLSQKTSIEVGEANIVTFLRSSLYIDLRFKEWWKIPGSFIEQMKGNRYFQEVMLTKSLNVYRIGALSKDIRSELEDQIGDAYARLFARSKEDIASLRDKRKAKLRKSSNLLALRARLPGRRQSD